MIEHLIRENVKALVSAYRRATKTSITQVSKRFYGNAQFLDAFFAGEQSLSVTKLDTMVSTIRAQWPADAEWPMMRAIVIPRPERRRRRKNSPGKTKPDS